MNNSIDILYTFVDSSDPVWLQKYFAYNKEINRTRFDSNSDHILFSLDTLEKYMPWINKIYIISDNQKFNLKSQFLTNKIVWVDHQEIIPNEFLPTFNSYTIEAFMHKAVGLSDYFLYFNDDMFLGSPVEYHDLFDVSTGKPIQFYIKCNYYNHPWMDNIRSSNQLFKHIIDFKHEDLCPQHAPYFIDKNLMHIVLEKFNNFLTKMFTSDKIRSYNEYSHNLLFLYAMYVSKYKYFINKRASFAAITRFDKETVVQLKNYTNRKQFYCFFSPSNTIEKRSIYQEIKDVILQD